MRTPYRLAIVGSRTFNDYELLINEVDRLIQDNYSTINLFIISGGARGADTLAKRFAEDNNFNYIEFPANWELYGKAAGFIRNKLIVENCDFFLAFWDGVSRGTKHSIDLAKQMNKKHKIILG